MLSSAPFESFSVFSLMSLLLLLLPGGSEIEPASYRLEGYWFNSLSLINVHVYSHYQFTIFYYWVNLCPDCNYVL